MRSTPLTAVNDRTSRVPLAVLLEHAAPRAALRRSATDRVIASLLTHKAKTRFGPLHELSLDHELLADLTLALGRP